jgi:hypothetical protein
MPLLCIKYRAATTIAIIASSAHTKIIVLSLTGGFIGRGGDCCGEGIGI